MATEILPNNPGHRHYPLYEHILKELDKAQPNQTAEHKRNLAAGLTDAYLDSLPASQRNLRLDETTVSQLSVKSGNANAVTPSIFLNSNPPVSTPLSTADVPAATTLADHKQQRTIGADGYLTDPNITQTKIPQLENGPMAAVNGIVMHRTEGSTASGTIGHWKGQSNPSGTHFIIDRDGTIHQTASLNNSTSHVGKIRSRGEVEGTLTPEDKQQLVTARAKPTSDTLDVHRLESRKDYPQRYPNNSDSVGIEVVGTYDEKTKRWQEPTEQQLESVRRLVGILQSNYGLNNKDVYEHDKISYKTDGEGANLYRPAVNPVTPSMSLPLSPAK
jgi:hypothetical protein